MHPPPLRSAAPIVALMTLWAAQKRWRRPGVAPPPPRQGGSLMGILQGPPAVKLYDAVIEQEFPQPATA